MEFHVMKRVIQPYKQNKGTDNDFREDYFTQGCRKLLRGSTVEQRYKRQA